MNEQAAHEFERRAAKAHDYEGNLVGYYIDADSWREVRALMVPKRRALASVSVGEQLTPVENEGDASEGVEPGPLRPSALRGRPIRARKP